MTDTPLAVDAKGMTKLLPVSLRTIRSWDCAGLLPEPCRIGGRVMWDVDEVREWIKAGTPDRKTWAAIRGMKKR